MTKNDEPDKSRVWINAWLSSVESGGSTMSQRKASSLTKAGGTLKQLQREAKKRNVHIVRLTDDKGNDLLAASLHPFRVIS